MKADMDPLKITRTLENCELFKGLEKSSIQEIAGLCHMQAYEPGEPVFHQGALGEHLYIIAQGHVLLNRTMDLGQRMAHVVIGMLGEGKAFGCWSTLLDAPRNLMCSASCKDKTEVVIIKGADLRKMMRSNMALGFNVLEKLCFLLRDRIEGAFGAMEKI